jgi:hypothetical protein
MPLTAIVLQTRRQSEASTRNGVCSCRCNGAYFGSCCRTAGRGIGQTMGRTPG